MTETFTQEQTAKAMGWSRAQVSQYAMLNKIDSEAWDIVATSFQNTVADDDDDAVAEIATGVAKSVFSENLLRNILDLNPGQQVELCGYLAKGKARPTRAQALPLLTVGRGLSLVPPTRAQALLAANTTRESFLLVPPTRARALRVAEFRATRVARPPHARAG